VGLVLPEHRPATPLVARFAAALAAEAGALMAGAGENDCGNSLTGTEPA
jgi:hypothetical protein